MIAVVLHLCSSCEHNTTFPPTRRLLGGAFDVLGSVGLRPAAAPSAPPRVGGIGGADSGSEPRASYRTRVDHDLRRELRRAYKAAGVSHDEVEGLAVYISRYVSAGSVQAVRPAAGRGVASFGYRPVADQVACDRYRPVAARAATESDESESTRAACCRSHGCGETKRQNKECAPPFQIFYRDLGGKHGALDGVRSDDSVSTVLHSIAAKLRVSEAATSKLRLLKAGKQLQVSGAACGLVKGDTVHVLGTLRGGVNVDAWQSPIYHKRQRAGAVPYASRKQTREALKPRNANECTPSLATAKKFTVRLTACRHDYRRALALLDEMRESGVMPNVFHYSAAITACEKGGQWRRALALLDEMRASRVTPNDYSFNAAISACEKGGQWRRALDLLDEMRASRVTPDAFSFNATISACEKGGQWQQALALLDEMRAKGVPPNVITFNAAISACARANQPEHAMRLWDELPLVPNAVSFNAVLDAVACWPRMARELWKLGLERGVYRLNQPYLQCVEGRTICLLDMHGLSEGAAEAATCWLFEEKLSRCGRSAVVTYDSTQIDGVQLITGWGRSRKLTSNGDIRARATATLDRLGLSLLPTGNPGRVIISLERAAESDAPPFQVFHRDLKGHHGTLDGVRSHDLASVVLRRIAAKLGLSEEVATRKLRLLKEGKELEASAACGLAKGDTVHVVAGLYGGVRSPPHKDRFRAWLDAGAPTQRCIPSREALTTALPAATAAAPPPSPTPPCQPFSPLGNQTLSVGVCKPLPFRARGKRGGASRQSHTQKWLVRQPNGATDATAVSAVAFSTSAAPVATTTSALAAAESTASDTKAAASAALCADEAARAAEAEARESAERRALAAEAGAAREAAARAEAEKREAEAVAAAAVHEAKWKLAAEHVAVQRKEAEQLPTGCRVGFRARNRTWLRAAAEWRC